MVDRFDLNQFIEDNVHSPGGFTSSTLGDLATFTQKQDLDPVQRMAFEKLLKACSQPYPNPDEVLSTLKIVSSQIPVLTQLPDQKLISSLKKKLTMEFTYARERARLSSSSTKEEKDLVDSKLFQFTGAVMILEYNISVFLSYRDADSAVRSQMYSDVTIENIGFSAPGIRTSVENQNTLTLFILKILDDQTREEILLAYQRFSDRILSAKPASQEVLEALRDFIQSLLPHFIHRGITQFSNLFPEKYHLHSFQEVDGLLKV